MVDEVSRLAMTLAISESGRVSFGAAGAAAFSSHSYAVGRLISSKKKIVPKLSWQQWPHFWDLKGKLQIRAQGERYVMRFDDRKAGNILLKEDRGFTEALCMVGATLGWIINHDNPNLLSGAPARVRMEHNLDSPVKQAYPQMRFDFKEGMNLTFVMLSFKYKRVCRLAMSPADHLLRISGCHDFQSSIGPNGAIVPNRSRTVAALQPTCAIGPIGWKE
ncbi:hypothetical protein ACLB2K_020873 [Fragaria x ananassa]